MSNTEYEYSFKVNSFEPIEEYCKKNNYDFVSKSKQTRTIYRNPNKTMARITINEADGKITKQLDFKEDNWVEGEVLKELKESQAIGFTDDEAVASILDFLNYKKDNTMIRTRTVYKTVGVKFELDEYSSPYSALVVGIEGDKDRVDAVFESIKKYSI